MVFVCFPSIAPDPPSDVLQEVVKLFRSRLNAIRVSAEGALLCEGYAQLNRQNYLLVSGLTLNLELFLISVSLMT